MQSIPRMGGAWQWLWAAALFFTGLPASAIEIHAVLSRRAQSTSYVLADDGRLWCWGSNDNGEYGDGTTNPSYVAKASPLPEGVTGWRHFRGGLRCLAIDQEGRLFGWGEPEVAWADPAVAAPNGRQLTPVQLGVRRWRQVAVPTSMVNSSLAPFGVGVDENGALFLLRMPKPSVSQTPAFSLYREEGVALPADAGQVIEVVAGAHCFLAVTDQGRLFAAGVDSLGLRGPRGNTPSSAFTGSFVAVDPPAGAGGWKKAALVSDTAFAWTQDDALWAWGSYAASDTGFRTTFVEPRRLPELPSNLPVRQVSGREGFVASYLFLDTAGTLYGCGPGPLRWPAAGPVSPDLFAPKAPLAVPPEFLPVTATSGNTQFELLMCGDGRIRALGENTHGQLGVLPQSAGGPFPTPVVPSGAASFLSGVVPELPILDLFAGPEVLVEPSQPGGADGKSGVLSVVRSGRKDQAFTPQIRMTARYTNGFPNPQVEVADLAMNLRELAHATFDPGFTRYDVTVTPVYHGPGDDPLLLDFELLPSPWYQLGQYPRATLEYRAVLPENPVPRAIVLWPPPGETVSTGTTIDFAIRFWDWDGYVARMEINAWGPQVDSSFVVREFPPVPPGTFQTLLVSLPVVVRMPDGDIRGSITVHDNKGRKSTTFLSPGQLSYRYLRSTGPRVKMGGREFRLPLPPTLGPLVLEQSLDLIQWTPFKDLSVTSGDLSAVVDLDPTIGTGRFVRMRNPDLPEINHR